jgi:hypothetical protein
MRYHFPDHPEYDNLKGLCERYKDLSKEQKEKLEAKKQVIA